MTTTVHVYERSVQTANRWLAELCELLGDDDRAAAHRVLRSVLHAIRDRLEVNEAAQLASQLPSLVRGEYYEGWRPAREPSGPRDVDSFLRGVAKEAMLSGETEASVAVQATMVLLRRHVSEGEIADVLAVMPGPLRSLLAA